ncbi:MAG: hypothetical protein R2830_23530 [Saprospiraceae bacterium]
MHTVSIQVDDNNDLQLLLLLVKRLGLKVLDKGPQPNGGGKVLPDQIQEKQGPWTKDQPLSEEEQEYHRKIIEAGVDMPESRLHEMLAWLEESRQDRKLPFRDE